jgi:hypothetical protein
MAAEKRPREEMMVQDLDMTRQALRTRNREAERLLSCLSTVETTLAAADRETTVADDTAGYAQAQLTGKALSLPYLPVLCGTASY